MADTEAAAGSVPESAGRSAAGAADAAGGVVRVTADDREPASGVVAALAAFPGVVLRVARLPVGDYEVDGRLLVERKTLADFAASVADGRLFRQARRLANAARPAVLILEGTTADLAAVGMRREALQGALISISLLFGLPVLRAQAPEETARLLLYAAGQLRRGGRGAGVAGGWRRARGKQAVQVRVLSALPGVGGERARRLLATFGTVAAVMRADTEALRTVAGIGQVTARRIRWAVEDGAGVYRCAAVSPRLPGGSGGLR